MAKFKNSNIELKTNQEILLGDSQEVSIKYDGSAMILDTTAIIVIGDVTADGFIGDGSQLTNLAAGNDTEVQFNDNGSLGSSSELKLSGSNLYVGESSGGKIIVGGGSGTVQSGVDKPMTIKAGNGFGQMSVTGAYRSGGTGGATVIGGGFSPTHGGGSANIQGGTGSSTYDGGDVVLKVGRAAGSGDDGKVVLQTVAQAGHLAPILEFQDDHDSPGVYTIGIRAPVSISASRIWSLPDDDPAIADGKFLTTNASGVLSFGSPDEISSYDSYVKVVDDGTAAGYVEIVTDGVQVSYWDAEGATIRLGKASAAGRVEISDTVVNASIGDYEYLNLNATTQRLGSNVVGSPRVSLAASGVTAEINQVIGLSISDNVQRFGVAAATYLTTVQSSDLIVAKTSNVETLRLTPTIQTLGIDGDSRIVVSQASDTVDIYCGATNVLAANLNGVTVTGDLQITGDLILDSTSALTASEVQYDNITPSTYNTVQDGMDTLGSAGLISGGVITADGTAAVNVTAGTGMLRTTNSEFADIEFIDFLAASSLAIAEDETKNIVVYYNGGSPEVQVVNIGTTNAHEYFILGQVGRAGDELFISNIRQRISNFAIRLLARLNGTEAVARNGNSGLIIGESGDTNRYVTMTSGEVWSLLDIESISSFNSGTGDEFTTIYRDSPSGYVETSGETQWDMEKYDNGSGTLQNLSNNRFGVRWFWYIPSSADMAMVYGTGNWKSLAEAEAEPVPTEVPGIITEYGVLIGKIIVEKNVDIAAEVSSAFDETYNFSAATDHGNLSNLAAPFDDHTQYSHIDGRRAFTDEVAGVYPTADASLVTKEYVDDQKPIVILVYGDSTAVDGDIIIVDATGEITITLIESVNAKITVKTIRDNVAIQGDSGTIDGNANVALSAQYESVTVVCDGINWYII